METVLYIAVIVGAYLLGSVSVSIALSSAVLGRDVRRMGSGNAGATNMARVYGMSAGVLTLAGDMLKAALAMLAGFLLLGDMGLAVAGIASIVGHCFPVYYGFRGGKGVSVGAAVAFAVDWRVALVVLAVFLVTALLSKKVSLGSLMAALSLTVGCLLFRVSEPRLALAVICALIVVLRHYENIRRLLSGTEPDFKPAGKKKSIELNKE